MQFGRQATPGNVEFHLIEIVDPKFAKTVSQRYYFTSGQLKSNISLYTRVKCSEKKSFANQNVFIHADNRVDKLNGYKSITNKKKLNFFTFEKTLNLTFVKPLKVA